MAATTALHQPFTAVLQRLDRLAQVRDETAAVVFRRRFTPTEIWQATSASTEPQITLHAAGEWLRPGWLPVFAVADVLVVALGPVTRQTQLSDLRTPSGDLIHRLDLAVTAQIVPGDDLARLTELAAQRGPHFGSALARTLDLFVEDAVRSLCAQQGAPTKSDDITEAVSAFGGDHDLADGALRFVGCSVAGAGSGEPSASSPPSAPPEDGADENGADKDAPGQPAALQLSIEADLVVAWKRIWPVSPTGIASGRTQGNASVVAVVRQPPPAYEGQQLAERFRTLLDVPRFRLVVLTAESYEDLVRAWFRQVQRHGGDVASVRTAQNGEHLEIVLEGDWETSRDDHHPAGQLDRADVIALRKLLPHHSIDFVPADVANRASR